MIFKLVKFFVKIGIAIIISLVLLFLAGTWLFKGTVEYVKGSDLPYDDVSYMITSYEKNAEAEPGTWCLCPVCDKYFYKDDSPCCSHKCEKEYHEIVNAWNSANNDKRYIENHGKKFK